jgi:hypothetical protein
LIGQTARAALAHARKAELAVKIVGSGVVARQEPLASSHVARGTQLTLHLRPPADVESNETVPAMPVPKGPEFSEAKASDRDAMRGGRDG